MGAAMAEAEPFTGKAAAITVALERSLHEPVLRHLPT
jgi:hypothetical protein